MFGKARSHAAARTVEEHVRRSHVKRANRSVRRLRLVAGGAVFSAGRERDIGHNIVLANRVRDFRCGHHFVFPLPRRPTTPQPARSLNRHCRLPQLHTRFTPPIVIRELRRLRVIVVVLKVVVISYLVVS
jgi:hypothetical protein